MLLYNTKWIQNIHIFSSNGRVVPPPPPPFFFFYILSVIASVVTVDFWFFSNSTVYLSYFSWEISISQLNNLYCLIEPINTNFIFWIIIFKWTFFFIKDLRWVQSLVGGIIHHHLFIISYQVCITIFNCIS